MKNKPKVARAIIIFEGQILLLVRADHDAVRPGEFDLPGGGIDRTDPTVEAGMIREIYEEAGIKASVEKIYEIVVPGTVLGEQDFERHVFLYVAESADVHIDPNEHKDFQWLPIAEAAQLFRHPFYSPAIEYVIREQLV